MEDRYRWARAVATVALLTLFPTGSRAQDQESPKELIERYFEGCFATEEPGCLEEFWSERAAENIRRQAERRRRLFPDISYALKEVIAEGDRVVAIFRVVGTAAETESSVAGGVLDHSEVAIYTVRGNRILRGEVIADLLAVTRALGYRVTPGDAEEP